MILIPQMPRQYLIYKLTTDLILNMFQKRLRGAVVINDSHAGFLQMKVEILIIVLLFINQVPFVNEFR